MKSGVRIGYIKGSASKITERFVDSMLIQYFGEYAEMIPIAPLKIIKLFNGSIIKWKKGLPDTLNSMGKRLERLIRELNISVLYLNFPEVIPYLFMVRSLRKVALSFFVIAHSVANAYWLRIWISIAPFVINRDIILCSTKSCCRALRNIAPGYKMAIRYPLFIEINNAVQENRVKAKRLLSIGRIEDIKNIHLLLEIFSEVKKQCAEVKLYIAGEYTGRSPAQITAYQRLIGSLIINHNLAGDVVFTGPLSGEEKAEIFRESALLVNLSTDPGETFGYNILEAKNQGIPVLCTRWNGFREVIKNKRDGLFVNCYWKGGRLHVNSRQAAAKLVRLLKKEAWGNALAAGSKQSVFRYDYKKIVPRIIAKITDIQSRATVTGNMHPEDLDKKISSLKKKYHPDLCRNRNFNQYTPLTILEYNEDAPYEEWLVRVKKIINHY